MSFDFSLLGSTLETTAQNVASINNQPPKLPSPSWLQRLRNFIRPTERSPPSLDLSKSYTFTHNPPPSVQGIDPDLKRVFDNMNSHSFSSIPQPPLELIQPSSGTLDPILSIDQTRSILEKAPEVTLPLSKQVIQAAIPGPTMQNISSNSTVKTLSLLQNIAPLIPFIPPAIPPLTRVLKRKERHIYNVEMTIKAKQEPIVYQISIRNKRICRTFAIEIAEGKPLEFSKSPEGNKYYVPPVLYPQRLTTFIVHILDTKKNPDLVDGSKVYTFPLSANEGLLVIHSNPFDLQQQGNQSEIQFDSNQKKRWSTVRKVYLKIDELGNQDKLSQEFPLLPFGETDLAKSGYDAIEVSQKRSQEILLI